MVGTLLLAGTVVAQDDEDPTIIGTVAGSSAEALPAEQYGVPFMPAEDDEQRAQFDALVEELGTVALWPTGMPEYGEQAFGLCDVWLVLPERLFD